AKSLQPIYVLLGVRRVVMSLTVSTVWAGPRPELHSFPTRRSSDLQALDARGGAPRRRVGGRGLPLLARDARPRARSHRRARRARSEEHTSELQSLAYLVCRLLLEKKKRLLRIFMILSCFFK